MGKRFLFLLTCMMISASLAFAQKTVSGTVTDKSTGESVIGATVRVEGTNLGAATDMNGNFTITNVPANAKVIKISYVGMQDVEAYIGQNLKIKMSPASVKTDEVVIVAYGTQKKESLTGAVSQINSDKIEERIVTSVTGALEGAAPGVQVNSTYGEPGSEPSILIRGMGTLTGTSAPLYILDGAEFHGNIAEINSSDVESMTVLKDAAACALYGNRAANGVIIITTKRGKGGVTPTITLNANFGSYNRGISEYERLGANQWMEASWMAMKNYAQSNPALGLSAADAAKYATAHVVGDFVQANIYDGAAGALFNENGQLTANMLPGYADDLDWEDAVERTGFRQNYTVSASASGERFNVYSSVDYLKENGYVRATDYTRYSGRINTEFRPVDWFKTGVNLNVVSAKQNYNSNATENYFANPFYTARYMAPVYAIHAHNADGSLVYDEMGQPMYDTTSPYLSNRNIAYEIREDKQDTRRNVINGLAFATIYLPYNFSVTVKGAVESSRSNSSKYNNAFIGDGAGNNGRFTSSAYQYTDYTFNQLLNWNHSYGLHNIEALLGHEATSWERKYTSGMNTDMAVDGMLVLGNFLTNSYFRGYDDEYTRESYLGRAAYNYDNKYFLEASFRRDGSSRFAKDSRWGNFYSVGAAWNMKRESWLQDVNWLDNLKLRASYGEIGNDRGVGYYAYQALYEIDKNGGNPAFLKAQLAANEIQWETTRTFDFGIDARFFDRLNVSIGYFDKQAKDLLFDVKLPYSAGSYSHGETTNMTQTQNIGTVSNRGIELAVDVDIIKTDNIKWNFGLDATFLSNKIKELHNHTDYITGSLRTYREGKSYYEWYTYHFEGVDQMTGRSLYTIDPAKAESAAKAGALVTINDKDYTTSTTYAIKKAAGKANPTVYGGFHTDFSWKDLSVNLLFTYGLGGKVYDGSYQELMSVNSASSASAMHKDVLKSWTGAPEGMTETSANRINSNGTPILDFTYSSDNNATSDRWLTDASYLVFKNINISYALPKIVANTLGIGGIKVNAGVENLFTLTSRKGLNPQYSFSGDYDDTYVTPRVFNFGISLQF